ncbi:lactate 2-monooxygenase [Natronomonas pharaonis DSM 2160]|uniref:Lactate 2-monooxygenase n=1 Tax=Natronomonas pharaonis (strain ATCC 35678 / DSM 2160 / CIP 103997 / JCM 8858 / NBRC 14720 / NCIMB 2260 / Gabara) TaxID=348780 RepID=A0A1U7EZC8_NATPD|nr:lactate 2-monooxygenase [Natronomonas pharaonis]CAI50653.1 lactate 2-monooxygenase [Natronomonas pharaonis DSM 2160]
MSEQFGNRKVNRVYREGMHEGVVPEFPASYEDLREQAHEVMDETARAYIHGGAGAEETFRTEQDFSEWRIVPRMLRGVEDRDLSTEVLGQTVDYPAMVTPLGVQTLVDEEGELATARACDELHVPFILSSLSSTPMEEVAEALGDTPKWFQFYWSADEDIARSFLTRAEEAGYDAIVVTVDAPTLGWRERLIDRGYYPFLEGEGVANYFSDPEFRSQLEAPPEEEPQAAVDHFLDIFGDASLTWDDLEFVFEHTDLPVLIKGVLHPEDAKLAVEHGADGVGVSTHGGRQVDGSITALEALPDIVDAVGDDVTVTFDSGIRRGADIYKALALGADACLIGRPFIYGLALGGQDGVEHVLENLIADFDLTMGLAGRDAATDLDRETLRHESHLPGRRD